eukprot:763733-Prorocentrum_minimum.AAC.1
MSCARSQVLIKSAEPPTETDFDYQMTRYALGGLSVYRSLLRANLPCMRDPSTHTTTLPRKTYPARPQIHPWHRSNECSTVPQYTGSSRLPTMLRPGVPDPARYSTREQKLLRFLNITVAGNR